MLKQPIWSEADKSLELSNNGTKNLSRFPSFFPERVSPRILARNQNSKGDDDSNATHDSSSDSEAEIEVDFIDINKENK